MRLKYSFEKMDLDDQIIAVPIGDDSEGFTGVIRLNETAAFIFDLLETETTEEEIVTAMSRAFNAPYEKLAVDVHQYLAEFQRKGLLV